MEQSGSKKAARAMEARPSIDLTESVPSKEKIDKFSIFCDVIAKSDSGDIAQSIEINIESQRQVSHRIIDSRVTHHVKKVKSRLGEQIKNASLESIKDFGKGELIKNAAVAPPSE